MKNYAEVKYDIQHAKDGSPVFTNPVVQRDRVFIEEKHAEMFNEQMINSGLLYWPLNEEGGGPTWPSQIPSIADKLPPELTTETLGMAEPPIQVEPLEKMTDGPVNPEDEVPDLLPV